MAIFAVFQTLSNLATIPNTKEISLGLKGGSERPFFPYNLNPSPGVRALAKESPADQDGKGKVVYAL